MRCGFHWDSPIHGWVRCERENESHGPVHEWGAPGFNYSFVAVGCEFDLRSYWTFNNN